jgi:hypothetical protein
MDPNLTANLGLSKYIGRQFASVSKKETRITCIPKAFKYILLIV